MIFAGPSKYPIRIFLCMATSGIDVTYDCTDIGISGLIKDSENH